MYKPLPNKHNKHNKLDADFYDGVYLGSRTITRYAPDSRWDYDFVSNIQGVPWDLNGEDVSVKLAPESDEEAMQRIEAKLAPVQLPVRRFKISPKDFEDIVFTSNCAGCNALREGTHNPGHDEDCRNRVEECLDTIDAVRKRLQ